MRYVPHEYQEYAKEFIISHKVSALFLDCGLGKTVITLTAIWELLYDYFDIRKILIIAPLRVCYLTWPSELEKWEHLSGIGMSAVLGSERERLSALDKNAQVYVINRENVEWLVENHTWDFDMVVIDELSSFKSHKAKRFKALKKVRPMVRRIVGLTGTPAPNGLIDLWAEIGILDMGQRLGRFIGGYRDRFFVPDKRSREMVFSYKPREGA
ncbi:DEAD/DEAH box helicase, partial [Lachnospiraceae bacterium]|nr:DEAD/DEAH box helicase [Lachnospiraceae bacterium]